MAPEITIREGLRQLEVSAQPLSPDEGARVLLHYRQKHPLAARELSGMEGMNMVTASPEQLESLVRESLPIVALRPPAKKLAS